MVSKMVVVMMSVMKSVTVVSVSALEIAVVVAGSAPPVLVTEKLELKIALPLADV